MIFGRSYVTIAGAVILTIASAVHAKDKDQPDSRSGHGQAADQRLVKNASDSGGSPRCGGPASTATNPITGDVTTICRASNGGVTEIYVKKGGRNSDAK